MALAARVVVCPVVSEIRGLWLDRSVPRGTEAARSTRVRNPDRTTPTSLPSHSPVASYSARIYPVAPGP